MLRNLLFAVLAVVGLASASQAAVMGSFRLMDAGKTTNAAVYDGMFDTYVFELQTTDGIVDALELDFSGNFLQTGNTTFKVGAANPVIFGFEAPDTFFVLPPGAAQLAANVSDIATELRAAWTTEGALPIVPGDNSMTPVAFISIASGTPAPTFADNVEMGLALIGGTEFPIVGGGVVPNLRPAGGSETFNDLLAAGTFSDTFPATDPEGDALSFSGLTLDYQPDFGGAGTPGAVTGGTLEPDGSFSFNLIGRPRGVYTAMAIPSDAGGAGSASSLILNVTRVPEPSTAALCGLAMVGLVGLIRRRG